MGTKTDFQAELLNLNSLLQASITELRYRCEVYRLSLKSISKVLLKVHQETRLRFLTTSRRSFQAYLLLSQKNALGRIGNVVRKASTFINGYSLVDKRLFQPPPPKPGCTKGKELCKTIFPSPFPGIGDGNDSLSSSSKPPAMAVSASQEKAVSKNGGELILCENKNNTKSDGDVKARHTITRDREKSAKKHEGSYDGRERKDKSSGDTGKRKRFRDTPKEKVSKFGRSGTRLKDERTRLKKNKDTGNFIKLAATTSRRSSRLNNGYSSSWTNNSNRMTTRMTQGNDATKKLPSLLTMKMSKYNLSHRTHSNRETLSRQQQVNREKLREEVRRAKSKDQRENRRSGGAIGKNANYKGIVGHQQGRRNSTSQRQARRKTEPRDDRTSSHRQTQSRNKIRESLAVIRKSRNPTSSTTRQGQGVAQKYLFSSSYSRRNSNNNGLKLPAIPAKTERVRRVRLQKEHDDNDEQEEQRGCGSSSSRKNAK